MQSFDQSPRQRRRRSAGRQRRLSAIRGIEVLESRAMLATNVFNVNGSWSSNGQAGTLSGTLSVDTDTGLLNGLNLSRVGGNMSNTTYGFDAITSQGPGGAGFSFTTAARGSYELRMSWALPTGSLSTYAGGSVSSFSFTSPTLGMFISGQSGSITKVNQAPADIALSSTSVAENAGANVVVGTLSTTDPDAGNTFTYTLVSGAGDTDNASFNLSGAQLRATASLDFEAKSSYSIRVRSTDQGGLFTEKTFTITVTNVNEGPTDIALSGTTVAENSPINSDVGELSTVAAVNGSYGYALVSGEGDTDNPAFTISGNRLRTAARFDFEASSTYRIRVRSTDSDGLFVEKPFTITVLDAVEPRTAPRLTLHGSITVIEDTPTPIVFSGTPFTDTDSPRTKPMTVTVSAPAGTLAAASADGVTVGGTAAARTFTGTLVSLNSYFTNPAGRVVYTPPPNATATPALSVTITERYGAQTLSSTAAVRLPITPVNDAPRVFAPARFVVREDTRTNLGWPTSPAGFRDVDSASLTVTLSVPDGSLFAAPVAGVNVAGTPTARVLTGSPAALTAYFKTLGRIAYTPALDNTVPRTLTTTVSDGIDTRVVTSTIAITPVNDVPRILAAAVISGSSSTAPLEITYETLRTATGATDVETANPTLVIQGVLSGTLQRWNGTAWAGIPPAAGVQPAQRTLQAGQKLRWIPPTSSTGLQAAFRVTASDGVAASTAACTVRILRA